MRANTAASCMLTSSSKALWCFAAYRASAASVAPVLILSAAKPITVTPATIQGSSGCAFAQSAKGRRGCGLSGIGTIRKSGMERPRGAARICPIPQRIASAASEGRGGAKRNVGRDFAGQAGRGRMRTTAPMTTLPVG